MPICFKHDEVADLEQAQKIIDDLMGQQEENSPEWNALNEIWCMIDNLLNTQN